MSNFLTIAAVTALLRHVLQDAIVTDVGGATVTTNRPSSITIGAQNPIVNIYLWRVTPNVALRNADVPTRSSDGEPTRSSIAALDLHYLLSFYGNEGSLEPQRLLGSVVSALHAQPFLTHQMMQVLLNDPNFKTDPNYSIVNDSGLANEVESVKFTPVSLSSEELSKIWSVFFQTPHALTVAYEASVVLIEGKLTVRRPLPVRTRELFVVQLRQPVIEEVISQDGEGQPIVHSSTLLILGKRFSGENMFVRIFGVEVQPDSISETQVSLRLSILSDDIVRAGVQGVQIVQPMMKDGQVAEDHWGIESNAGVFVLRPVIASVIATKVPASGTEPQSVDVTVVGVKPIIGKAQRVVLLLDRSSKDLPSYTFLARPRTADSDSITINTVGVEEGEYLVRIQVDGAESPLTCDSQGKYNSPKVTIS